MWFYLLLLTSRRQSKTLCLPTRLAPEYLYPTGINDGYTALKWVRNILFTPMLYPMADLIRRSRITNPSMLPRHWACSSEVAQPEGTSLHQSLCGPVMIRSFQTPLSLDSFCKYQVYFTLRPQYRKSMVLFHYHQMSISERRWIGSAPNSSSGSMTLVFHF